MNFIYNYLKTNYLFQYILFIKCILHKQTLFYNSETLENNLLNKALVGCIPTCFIHNHFYYAKSLHKKLPVLK